MALSLAIYALAALAEIAGCFAFWSWARQGASGLWLLPGLAALVAFAYLLTFSVPVAAGRSFAAYGGVYILASLLWMWLIEGEGLRARDVFGAALAIAGAVIILSGEARGG